MKKRKRQKIFRRITVYLVLLFSLVTFFYYVNHNIVLKYFLTIKGDTEVSTILKSWITENQGLFITKKRLMDLPLDSIDKSIARISLKQKFFLIWELSLETKISNRYIMINNQIHALDFDSNLLEIPINQEEIKKQIPFILKIEILEKLIPQKSKKEKEDQTNLSKDNETNKITPIDSPAMTEIDIYNIYQKDIKPFVEYLYKSDSSLGPKITLIQSFPKIGIRFYLYQKIYWIGFLTDYDRIEKKIEQCESYLKQKNKLQSYNEFDLRYKNQIICRNNQ